MTSGTPFHGPVALKAIIENTDGKVLVCLNNHPGEPWDLPGGTLNAGEHPHDALVREVKEELGIDIFVGDVVGIDHFIKPMTGKQTIVIALRGVRVDPLNEPKITDGELSAFRWIGSDELDTVELYPQYRAFLDSYFKAKN